MSDARGLLRGIFERLEHRAAAIESWSEWIYPRRSLRFTREGWFFLVVTVAIGLAALNTGHNLFYLLFAMLVSLIVVSGLLSERTVRSLVIERHLPGEVFARSATAIEIRVRNQSPRRASYAVEIRDAVEGHERSRVGFIDRLDPGGARTFVWLMTFPRRGRRKFRSVHLRTRFPFGLFEKTRIVPAAEMCVVFPAVGSDHGERASRGEEGQASRKSRSGEEIVGLRRKLADDDPRHIHWRVSARIGQWMVTEHAEALDRPLVLFFDSRGPGGDAFEAAIERAARLLWTAYRENRAMSFDSWQVSFSAGESRAALAALAFLAEVEPAPADSELPLARWREHAARIGGGVFVTAGEAPSATSAPSLRVA